MKTFRLLSSACCALALIASAGGLGAQSSAWDRFRSHNFEMTRVQPGWVSPVFSADGRLGQGVKLSVANTVWPGGNTWAYGNNRGLTLVGWQRVQLEVDPPAFFRNHSKLLADGWGNATVQGKLRLFSSPSDKGAYIVTAGLTRSFTPGAKQNAGLTGAWVGKLLAGKQWGRFDLQTQLNGGLPTGKVSAQGRTLEWNWTAQTRTVGRLWASVENNSAWFLGGPLDGKMQNFVSPQLAYQYKQKNWGPKHPIYILACGMQFKSSGYAMYNHNLVSELRVLF